jgi:hypothetical protein
MFYSAGPRDFKTLTSEGEKLPIEGVNAFKRDLNGRPVIVAAKSHLLIRAAIARNPNVRILFLSSVLVLGSNIALGERVSIVDHVDISGASPLVGRNLAGERFPPGTGLYRAVPGLKRANAFLALSAGFVEASGMKAAALALGCDVMTAMGPQEALVAGHAGGQPVAHVGFACHAFQFWQIPSDDIARFLFA